MGGAGSAWIKPKKRDGLRPAMLAAVPHPMFLRPGQRFAPRRASGRRGSVTVRIMRAAAEDERVLAQREDDDQTTVRLSAARLLAARADSHGLHYRFLGHVPGRRYRTHAVVVSADAHWARVVCPEWHPKLAIAVAVGGLPPEARHAGAWVRGVADLGAGQPGHVQLRELAPPEAGFDPGRYHPVAGGHDDGTAPPTPRRDAGDGDVVLFLGAAELAAMQAGRGIYLTGNPPPATAGARVYAHHDGAVRGWCELVRKRRLPNGVRLELAGDWHAVTVPVSPERPRSGVADGAHGHQRWVARGWPRAAEQPA